MTLYINEVEAFWFLVTLATFVLTLFSLAEAREARRIVKKLNGHAREIAANGNLRRETIRLIMQTLLLIVVIPSLFSDYQIELSPSILALIAVPVALFVNSALDALDRRRLIGTIQHELLDSHEAHLARIEDAIHENKVAIDENTELTQLAADHADHAYKEANSVNDKIATQGAVIVQQGADAVTDRARGGRIEKIGKDTNARTKDIQERLP